MNLYIKDPRKFSEIYPDSNMLINQSMHDLKHNESDAMICALIEDLLKQKQDQTLSVGFSLSPNLAVANHIWNALQKSINNTSKAKSYLFALPILFVVGSKDEVVLNNQIDVNAIKGLFKANNVIGDEFVLYDNLVDIEIISKLKPSMLQQWSEQDLAEINLANYLASNPIKNHGEQVYLKYVVGYAKLHPEITISMVNFAKCNLEFMQLINQSIKNDNATIFPITFAPCSLSEATVVGNNYYNEIVITFALGNEIKKYRLEGKIPFVKISTADNVIRINLCIKDSYEIGKQLNWNLHPVDSFEKVNETLARLFIDMQLDVVYDNE